jgi:hypothetical protein
MGGSSGGGISPSDLAKLQTVAKQKLKEAANQVSPHVFISFAYEDINDINLLRAQVKNEDTDLQFDDYSVREAFDSTNVDYIKRQIREKIDRSSVTLVYVTENSAQSKWVNWEIEESQRRGKGVVGVFKGDKPPFKLPPAFATSRIKVVKLQHDELDAAIQEARQKR